jgi:DNA gyrase subunit B
MYTTQASMKLFDSATHGEGAELFIVEGDSAARSVAALRNDRMQAVLPLQGKPLNAWKASAARVAASPLYRQLSAALGTRDATSEAPRDADGLRFGRVLLLFDPDADGVHICALMLLYFQRWMPDLLASGRVLVVRAPMFAITHPRLPAPVHAWSQAHAQAITAQWRADGLEGADLHRYLGLGSIPPPVLDTTCVDPRTRSSRVAGADDVAAVHAAFGGGAAAQG